MAETHTSPNVYGIETEYSCMITYPGNYIHELVGVCHGEDDQIELHDTPESKNVDNIPMRMIKGGLTKMGLHVNMNGMLSNGGRFYIDPSGPEYCTPETATAEDVVHRTFDGDEVLFGVFRSLQERDIINSFQINRRIVDHNRSSRGVHLNTLTTVDYEELNLAQRNAIAALNVAKGALFGSGGLLLDEKGKTSFYHSPRLAITTDLEKDFGDYKRRPLIRKPFKPDNGCNRVETVSVDALNFAWPLRASIVATNALFKMFELGWNEELPWLREPIRAARMVGKLGAYCTVAAGIGEKDYTGVRPLSILNFFVNKALEKDNKTSFLDSESRQVLGEITEVSDLVAAKSDRAIANVESLARLHALQRKMDKTGVGIDSEKVCRFDYYWDKIGGGMAESLRKNGKAGWLGFDRKHSVLDTKKRIVRPPSNTRAATRGELIKDTNGDNHSTWTEIYEEDTHESYPIQLGPFDRL